MTGERRPTGAPDDTRMDWDSIDWKTARKFVRRLQARIAKAALNEQHGKVQSLQWLLVHSFYAKALAVKRVTSNKGKRTPGIDNVLWRTSRQKPVIVDLERATIPIERHVKVRANTNPYLPEDAKYLRMRKPRRQTAHQKVHDNTDRATGSSLHREGL